MIAVIIVEKYKRQVHFQTRVMPYVKFYVVPDDLKSKRTTIGSLLIRMDSVRGWTKVNQACNMWLRKVHSNAANDFNHQLHSDSTLYDQARLILPRSYILPESYIPRVASCECASLTSIYGHKHIQGRMRLMQILRRFESRKTRASVV